jgi:phosphatidylserine/phosphatidylglycerophosphate/cardiolipin synthase-like enzyme
LASFYFDYRQRLKAQGNSQGKAFRNENNAPRTATVDDKEITLWFSPNTQANTKTRTSETPADIAMVFDLIDKAKQGILFLLFQPGTPSVADEIEKIAESRPDLFVRGAVTDPKVAEEFDHIDLYHRGSSPPDTVVPATEVKDQFSFWEKEILKTAGAHAIIHDKIVVIDPFGDQAIVCTGSHNDGYRASYMNDENLLIIRGNQELAQALETRRTGLKTPELTATLHRLIKNLDALNRNGVGLTDTLKMPVRDYLGAVLPGVGDFPVGRIAELTPTTWASRN